MPENLIRIICLYWDSAGWQCWDQISRLAGFLGEARTSSTEGRGHKDCPVALGDGRQCVCYCHHLDLNDPYVKTALVFWPEREVSA